VSATFMAIPLLLNKRKQRESNIIKARFFIYAIRHRIISFNYQSKKNNQYRQKK